MLFCNVCFLLEDCVVVLVLFSLLDVVEQVRSFDFDILCEIIYQIIVVEFCVILCGLDIVEVEMFNDI